MKKIIFFGLVLFLLVASARAADVVIRLEQVGETNEVKVIYDTNGEPNIRAFGLDITTDGCDIYKADANTFDANYWVYPGSIDINSETGLVDDNGTPICDPNELPAGSTLPGLDSNGVTLEMGSLYVGGPNGPAKTGTLMNIFVGGETDVVVGIKGNAARTGTGSASPGIVFEDPCHTAGVIFKGLTIVRKSEWGDAPDPTYPTKKASTGASHKALGVKLGTLRDVESDGQPNASATGDDLALVDDEDGIKNIRATGWANGGPSVTVTTTDGPGKLYGWIDWNKDGDWADAGEYVVSGTVVDGTDVVVPLTGHLGAALIGGPTFFSRWRVIMQADSLTTGYLGPANTGEVEDYNKVTCSCKGEITGDGKVNVNDVIAINGWIGNFGSGRPKSILSSAPNFRLCADADLSGKININDVIKINGWIGNYGSGRPKSRLCPHNYN